MRLPGPLALDVETRGERRSDTADPRRARFFCAAYAPAGIVTYAPPRVLPGAEVTVHNVPYDPVVLGTWDARWDDTKVLAHLGGEFDTTLKGLAVRKLGRALLSYDEAVASGEEDRYCLADAEATWELRPLLYDELLPQTRRLYDELERPLLPLWAKMTLEGSFLVDRDSLVPYRDELAAETETARLRAAAALPAGREVRRCRSCRREAVEVRKGQACQGGVRHTWATGWELAAAPNVNAPAQLLRALNQAGVPARSTDVEELFQYRAHPAVAALLDYRAKSKLLSTYVEPWLTTPEGERLGSIWRVTGTPTGRVSSAGPNLQNIPASLRPYLRAAPGRRLLTFDNSQLEVRTAAHLSQDPVLLSACRTGDLHGALMAAFGLTDRRRAKVWVFGTMYLGGPPALLRNAAKYGDSLTWAEAEAAQAEVRRRMPGYFQWADRIKDRRVIEGLFGRIHHIPPGGAAHADKQAVNWPVQGGAATVTKYQMLALWRAGYDVRSQVHDSVTVEVDEAAYADAVVEVARIMEDAVSLDVPIRVELQEVPDAREVHR